MHQMQGAEIKINGFSQKCKEAVLRWEGTYQSHDSMHAFCFPLKLLSLLFFYDKDFFFVLASERAQEE